jgi:sigma-54 dependent transcriptional regulator, acetoin dehydrogenase operon transcriptional activator AcoR
VRETITFDDSLSRSGAGRVAWLIRAMQSARPLDPPVLIELPAAGELRLGRGTGGVSRAVADGRVAIQVQTDDDRMSTAHASVVQRAGRWVLVDDGSKNGSYVNGARVAQRALDDGDLLAIGATMFVYRSGPGDLARAAAATAAELPALRTAVPELAGRLAVLERLAPSAIAVLIQGETGTGKELAARAIHALAGRAGPFVAVNCGALAETLLESQLFGHKKGAFSGADRDSPGLVRAADRGTLFLDEIAELSPPSQVALLRVLQEREVLPVGATAPVAVDVRVVAATHQDLEARIATGLFREDLFARITGARLELWPLRRRKEDLGLLVAGLLGDLAGDRAASIRFSRRATRALFAYDWPRNVRELRAALELALTAADGDVLGSEHLPDAVADPADASGSGARVARPAPAAGAAAPADDREPTRDALVEALRAEHGNVSAAARRAGYSRAHFHRLMKRFAIDPAAYR